MQPPPHLSFCFLVNYHEVQLTLCHLSFSSGILFFLWVSFFFFSTVVFQVLNFTSLCPCLHKVLLWRQKKKHRCCICWIPLSHYLELNVSFSWPYSLIMFSLFSRRLFLWYEWGEEGDPCLYTTTPFSSYFPQKMKLHTE